MAAKKSVPVPAVQFYAAGILKDDRDAEVVGRALLEIAERHGVEGLRALDARIVLDDVLASKDHPLRPYYNWDVDTAARAHWLDRTSLLIRGVRCVYVQVNQKQIDRPKPLFVTADASVRSGERIERRRVQVVREDALHDAPTFMSAISLNIRRIQDALVQLERMTADGSTPGSILRLVKGLRQSMDDYSITLDVAAE